MQSIKTTVLILALLLVFIEGTSTKGWPGGNPPRKPATSKTRASANSDIVQNTFSTTSESQQLANSQFEGSGMAQPAALLPSSNINTADSTQNVASVVPDPQDQLQRQQMITKTWEEAQQELIEKQRQQRQQELAAEAEHIRQQLLKQEEQRAEQQRQRNQDALQRQRQEEQRQQQIQIRQAAAERQEREKQNRDREQASRVVQPGGRDSQSVWLESLIKPVPLTPPPSPTYVPTTQPAQNPLPVPIPQFPPPVFPAPQEQQIPNWALIAQNNVREEWGTPIPSNFVHFQPPVGQWNYYGEDATQVYQFDTSKDNETAEVLNKEVMVFTRTRTPDLDFSEGQAKKPQKPVPSMPSLTPIPNPATITPAPTPAPPVYPKPVNSTPQPSQQQQPIIPQQQQSQTISPTKPVQPVVQPTPPVQPQNPQIVATPPPSTDHQIVHDDDFITITIHKSAFYHFVVVVIFASIFFRYIICKPHEHEHHYAHVNALQSGTSEALNNSVDKIKNLFHGKKQQHHGSSNKLYQEEFEDP